MLEGECWNSKCCQPNTLTSLDLCIDGFSCCYQLMALAGLFIPIIPFLNHMILFSDFPLTSLPSFLYDSLTTQLCIFPFLLYLVMFISHSSDIVPQLSATSELTIYRFYCAQFASHSHGAVRLNRRCQKSKNGWHMRGEPGLSPSSQSFGTIRVVESELFVEKADIIEFEIPGLITS